MDARELDEYVSRANEQRRAAAEATRRRGQWHYLLIYGALQFGGLLALLVTLIIVRVTGPTVYPPFTRIEAHRVLSWLVFVTPFAVTSGVLVRLWMWNAFRRRWWNTKNPD